MIYGGYYGFPHHQEVPFLEKYQYDNAEMAFMEESCIPFAVYQFINKRVVTIVLSQGFMDLFGFVDRPSTYELMDNDMYRDTHPDDVGDLADAAYRFAVEEAPYDVIYRNLKGSEYRIIHAYGKHVVKEDGTRLAFIWYTDQGAYTEDNSGKANTLLSVLSESLREKTINHLVSYDYLTGFPSMSYFFELADAGCRDIRKDNKCPAILFTDFNGTKNYNHKYGMAEGDKLLSAFAKLLITHFPSDNCSRFSSDHFCVFTDSDGCEDIAREIISESRDLNNGKSMPVRIGIYYYDDENLTITAACDRAKIACDSRKKTYESHISIFDDSMSAEIERKHYIVDNLDRAIAEGWIQVYHQPIIRTSNDRVCNEEALARWMDPERGMISPGDFIPVLEEANTIYKLDLCVLDQVLQKLKLMEEKGFRGVPESINLSRSDFYACDIVEEIRRRVDDSGISRERIILEITESIIADDLEYMTKQILRFKELGFKIWMDDFGSGYSSPIMLQKIPFDLIKIDMQFVRQIGVNKGGKIILTEIVKLALALDMETVAEGVETKEQMEFLKEIGCTMLQGFFFSKPNSLEKLNQFAKEGFPYMFENPAETDYYVQIGKVNLYDLSSARGSDDQLNDYFDIWPMALMECYEDRVIVARCNSSFRDFFNRTFPNSSGKREFMISGLAGHPGAYSLNAILQCSKDGQRAIVDDRTPDGKNIQLLIGRIAVNPVSGASCVGVAILSVVETTKDDVGLTYNYVARALSEDYVHMYFVNLDTEDFIEYVPDGANMDISIERKGMNFFAECKKDAIDQIYKDDLDEFLKVFNKDNIERNLRENGIFTHTYRNVACGEPVYFHMKIVRVRNSGNNIIIGVNNISAQMKHKEAMEKIREERLAYARIIALSGEYMAVYTIDPVTDSYMLFSSKEYFDAIGSPSEGKNFYTTSIKEAEKVIHPEDWNYFRRRFKKKAILDQIREKGIFSISYRMIVEGKLMYIQLRAAMIHEGGQDKVIIGVLNVEKEIRKEQEYASNLSAARAEANLDELTGVKNKHAYVDYESQINKEIQSGDPTEFAVIVFDINDLKLINDTKGHQAGDKYIKDGCKVICKAFKQSPVFRLGGDEFAVIARGEDYRNVDANMEKIFKSNIKNKSVGKVVIAAGMSKYSGDKKVSAVFERADMNMYDNKRLLKE
jgi:diguanylate cyclase (GGDEF)-like protein